MDKQEKEFFRFIVSIILLMAGAAGLLWLFINAF